MPAGSGLLFLSTLGGSFQGGPSPRLSPSTGALPPAPGSFHFPLLWPLSHWTMQSEHNCSVLLKLPWMHTLSKLPTRVHAQGTIAFLTSVLVSDNNKIMYACFRIHFLFHCCFSSVNIVCLKYFVTKKHFNGKWVSLQILFSVQNKYHTW